MDEFGQIGQFVTSFGIPIREGVWVIEFQCFAQPYDRRSLRVNQHCSQCIPLSVFRALHVLCINCEILQHSVLSLTRRYSVLGLDWEGQFLGLGLKKWMSMSLLSMHIIMLHARRNTSGTGS